MTTYPSLYFPQEPILDPVEFVWLAQEPLASAVTTLEQGSEQAQLEQYPIWKENVKREIEARSYWVQRVVDWLAFVTGGIELSSEAEAIDVFVDCMWLRHIGQDENACKRLRQAQQDFLELPIPSKFNNGMLDKEEEEQDVEIKVEPIDLSELRLGSTSEFLQLRWEQAMPTNWKRTIREDPETQYLVCRQWSESLAVFFSETNEPGFSESQAAVEALRQMRKITTTTWSQPSWQAAVKTSGLSEVVIDICKPSKQLDIQFPHVVETFRRNVWRETLGELLYNWTPKTVIEGITKDLNDLKTTNTFREGGITCTPLTLLQTMSEHPESIPRISNPASIFFLVNSQNFAMAWERWLQPALDLYGIATEDVNVKELHRRIRGLDLDRIKSEVLLDETLELILAETEKLVKQSQLVVESSVRSLRILEQPQASNITAPSSKASAKTAVLGKMKKIRRRGKKTSPPSEAQDMPSSSNLPTPSLSPDDVLEDGLSITLPLTNSCPHCSGRDKDEWCVRIVEVERLDGDYQGCVLTEAPEHDRLRPKDIRPGMNDDTKYYHPKDLGLKALQPRPEVFARCAVDTTLLVSGALLVGAVKFGAFSSEALTEMQDHHETSSVLKTVKRGASFRAFAKGSSTMKAIGSRLPQGGNPGSGYGPYADVKADTHDDIRTLFKHAEISDKLMHAARHIYYPVTKVIGRDSVSSGMDPLGSTGSNMFICRNYVSPIHVDDDLTISACMQLDKRCPSGEWNFAYAQWGYYIETIPNTLWLFYGTHQHGTIMPSRSTMAATSSARRGNGRAQPAQVQAPPYPPNQQEAGAAPALAYPRGLRFVIVDPRTLVSTGVHNTIRRRDRIRAAHYQAVRRSYLGVARHWQT
ncbi:hypothetical protein EYR40_002819 [Pleurotus pulmonarius]|nr:hypothetical protein EYR40_002819 [Pleurotus pulmonarius]KAF4582331.1 hypothetical protein EYR38_002449 [Pleurotus pulmonarius]